MPGASLAVMLWEVAYRYGFSEAEILAMPMSRLTFWHDGHRQMLEAEGGGSK